MSVQSSLPLHSSTTATTETNTTPPGQKGDLPGAENGYLVQEPMGEEVQVDLDGDGELETVTIATKQIEQKNGDAAGRRRCCPACRSAARSSSKRAT